MQSATNLAAILKSAGDSLRLDILAVLKEASFGVQELASIFEMSQPAMSHHLKLLLKSRLVETRRDANSIFYKRSLLQKEADDFFIKKAIFDSLDGLTLSCELAGKVQKVFEMRAQSSKEYFQKNADEFYERQRKITSTNEYLEQLLDVMANEAIDAGAKVLEVGPGDGELLKELLSKSYDVVALDSSENMLAKTKAQLTSSQRRQVEFIETELSQLNKASQFDLVCMNMVLHHMASPEQAFDCVARALKSEGVLLLADLCPHNQEWAQQLCGDVWMGFSPEELSGMAESAGFSKGLSSFVGLKNGFQIQLRTFLKHK